MRKAFTILFCLLLLSVISASEELPIPSYSSVVIISIEHSIGDKAEVDYIKKNLDFGLYAWLCFSRTHVDPVLDWHTSWEEADSGIQSFKDTINSDLQKAEDQNIRLHFVLCSGLARGLYIYKEAKEEDIRNCQWYNDNKLASDEEISDSGVMDKYVFGTFSRYARKLRRNIEAKSKAALSFLSSKMSQNPDILTALSGWGEAELNYNRINPAKTIQDDFCDYSPFAVLEFRDWICHAGMYDDASGKYAGEGYSDGGSKYQGAAGLKLFNQEFGTSFATWELKYYNWSLDDTYDTDPTDNQNNDPNRIPFSDYRYGGMMPTSGARSIAGGFDPPRIIKRGDKFWDLWNLFRETMVLNFVKDMAKWADEAGIPSQKWYSHQIAADYLFGSSPEAGNQGGRYYTSASPLWTADVRPYGSVGATMYDIKFPKDVNPNEFVRTTEYGLAAISEMAKNWAIMEYDAETYPPGFNVSQSETETILEQYLRVYDYRPHLINFWRWWDADGEHRIKGMNKEKALRLFVKRIRDKARGRNLSVVFDPPKVAAFSGEQDIETRMNHLKIGNEIWTGHPWKWKDWGDFDHFEIYRGEMPNFASDAQHLLVKTADFGYVDGPVEEGEVYYYKVRAVNSKGKGGSFSRVIRLPEEKLYILDLKTEGGGTTEPPPGIYSCEPGYEMEVTAVPESGNFFLGWSGDASGKNNPINVVMDRDKTVTARFSEIIIQPPLNVQGERVENRSLVFVEYAHRLSWEDNPENSGVAAYRIYEVIGEKTELLGEVGGDVFEYMRRDVEKEREYIYEITAVHSSGRESEGTQAVI
jgi:hypothetical protein